MATSLKLMQLLSIVTHQSPKRHSAEQRSKKWQAPSITAGLAAILSSSIGAVKVEAAPPNLGLCPAPAYISQGSSASAIKLNSVNLLTGQLTTISTAAIPNGVNAIGLNQKDGYIYGIQFGSNKVKRIDANGVSYDLGAITGLPSSVTALSSYVVGDVDANGVLHVLAQGGNTIYAIDVTEASPTYLKLIKTIPITIPTILDFAFHPTNGKLYTADSSGNVYEITLPTGTGSATVKTLGTSVLPQGGPFDPYGSIYFANDGSLYAYMNSGEIYRVTNLLGSGALVVQTLTKNAASVQQNDGARCPLAPPIFPPNTADYGDAPDSGGNTGVGSYQTLADNNGPVHEIISGLRIGTLLDGEDGTLQNAAATADNTNNLNDEDGVANFPTLDTNAGQTYTVPVSITNTTGGSVYLVGYIDFNKDGDFDDTGEKSSTVTVPNNPTGTQNVSFTKPAGMTAGDTYARFRVSKTQTAVESPIGPASSGEVEDYRVPIVAVTSKAQVLLVERITAINGDRVKNPRDNTPLNIFVDDTTSPSSADDNNTRWPIGYLLGAIHAGKIRPGDDVEHTVYFLNAGGANADLVRICDRMMFYQQFQPDTYATDKGIQLQLGTSPVVTLTNANDGDDRTQFIAAGQSVPANCNLKAANDYGTIVVDVTGATGTGIPNLTTIPGATSAGVPNDSYGFFRFVTKTVLLRRQ